MSEHAKHANNANVQKSLQRKKQKAQIKRTDPKVLESRRKVLVSSRRGANGAIVRLLMLFVLIVNYQLLEKMTEWKAIQKGCAMTNSSASMNVVPYRHFMETGNILIVIYFCIFTNF